MQVIELPAVASTNTYLKAVASQYPTATVVTTPCQTAGRGQQGNSWEAEPGKNLTFSLLHKPAGTLPARHQFALSEATALAVADVASMCCPDVPIRVKWPNDVYAADYKIAGLLIEHVLYGDALAYSIIGVGLNVNQTVFVSNAPNPASLAQLSGHDFDLPTMLTDLARRIEAGCTEASTEAGRNRLHRHFLNRLYRHDGQMHLFATPDGTQFAATVVNVDPDGVLTLRHNSDGSNHRYSFKQVKHVVGRHIL